MLYDDLLKGLHSNNLLQPSKEITSQISKDSVAVSNSNDIKLFNINGFIEDVRSDSESFNRKYLGSSETVSAYDAAHNCVRIPIFKLRHTPIDKYSANWLPISFRSELGHAAHEFIQKMSKAITETELTLKVPSLRLSVRLDAVINDNVLIEIKSVPYRDYQTILKKQKPRDGDFLQAVLYKYLLEEHLDEIKQQKGSRGGVLPKLDKYKIKFIQHVYVCHELIAGDTTSITEEVKIATALKKSMNSKYNPFWFITALNIDTESIDINSYQNHLIEKINLINTSLKENRIPSMSNKFIDTKGCFFCLFKKPCKSIP